MTTKFDAFNGNPQLREQLDAAKTNLIVEVDKLLGSLEEVPRRLGDALHDEIRAFEKKFDPREWFDSKTLAYVIGGTLLTILLRKRMHKSSTGAGVASDGGTTTARHSIISAGLKGAASIALRLAIQSAVAALRSKPNSGNQLANLDRSRRFGIKG
ncbi:MAG: hypothetical protein K1X83_07975 [Oligoflexia bacterium]|nr:hypothetical protein [Oligoflexia bacterium]